MDFETDALIQRALRKEFGSSTILTIAHRLQTVVDYSRILVLDQGTIREFDTPNALLQNPNSLFSNMVEETGPTNAALLRRLAAEAAKGVLELSEVIDALAISEKK